MLHSQGPWKDLETERTAMPDLLITQDTEGNIHILFETALEGERIREGGGHTTFFSFEDLRPHLWEWGMRDAQLPLRASCLYPDCIQVFEVSAAQHRVPCTSGSWVGGFLLSYHGNP